MSTGTYREPARELPMLQEVDVLVVGGGPGGIGAAVGAAQQGASVALVERFGALGGMMSMGYVTACEGAVAISGDQILIQGVWKQLVDRMVAKGGCIRDYELIRSNKFYPYDKTRPENDLQITPYDPEIVKIAADELAREHGIHTYLYTLFVAAIVEDGAVCGAIVENKSGRGVIRAKRVVDATGDAMVCRAAGVECTGTPGEKGQLTLEFRVGGVKDATPSYAMVDGMPNGNVNFFPLPRQGEVRVEMTRFDGDSQSAGDLTEALMACRRQVHEVFDYLKKNWAGFEDAYLIDSAPMLGSLVYPRLVGEYSVTQQDILGPNVPEDRIAITAFGIDIPDPEDRSKFILAFLQPGEYYGIPYRALVPKSRVENILMGCRCASSDDDAASATICSAISMAVGEAAGVASALSIQRGVTPRDVDVAELQAALKRHGALLDPVPVPVK